MLAAAKVLSRPCLSWVNRVIWSSADYFRSSPGNGHRQGRPPWLKGAMYGRRPRRKRNLTFQRSVRVQPCIRPLNAATLAAGLDVIR